VATWAKTEELASAVLFTRIGQDTAAAHAVYARAFEITAVPQAIPDTKFRVRLLDGFVRYLLVKRNVVEDSDRREIKERQNKKEK
jgi:hypothetical protein